MHLTCPHCQNPIELVTLRESGEVLCASCGTPFRVEDDTTVTWSGTGRGENLGRFELRSVVGTGAFGTVSKAHDTELDCTVAVKVPRAVSLAAEADRNRFLREARSAAQLRHPAIVPVHEVGRENGLPYLVSEFVEGGTLDDRLTTGRRPFREAAALVVAVWDLVTDKEVWTLGAHAAAVTGLAFSPESLRLAPAGRDGVVRI